MGAHRILVACLRNYRTPQPAASLSCCLMGNLCLVGRLQLADRFLEKRGLALGVAAKVKPSVKRLCLAEGLGISHFAQGQSEADDGQFLLDVPPFTCWWREAHSGASAPPSQCGLWIIRSTCLRASSQHLKGHVAQPEHSRSSGPDRRHGSRSRCPIPNRSPAAPRPAQRSISVHSEAFRDTARSRFQAATHAGWSDSAFRARVEQNAAGE